MKTLTSIEHNLKIAEPRFLYFIKGFNYELAQWVQYKGFEISDDQIFFIFKSSQNSLSFKVYAGININNIDFKLNAKSEQIYNYFKNLKYKNI